MNSSGHKWFGRIRHVASAVVMALIISACSPAVNTAIVGKWQEKGDTDITEFRADGTFTLHSGERLTGKYTSAGSDYIKLTFDGGIGKVIGTSKWKAVVRGDVLELTDPDGNKAELQRVK